MPTVHPFYPINEDKKTREERVFHNNPKCKVGHGIQIWERKQSTNNYRLCPVYAGLVGE
jgi:hypothetical protein